MAGDGRMNRIDITDTTPLKVEVYVRPYPVENLMPPVQVVQVCDPDGHIVVKITSPAPREAK